MASAGADTPTSQEPVANYAQWLVDHRLGLALGSAVLLLLTLPGLGKLRYTTDIYHFFDPAEPLMLDYQQHVERYTTTHSLVLLVDAAGIEPWSVDGREIVAALHRRIARMAHVVRLRSPLNARYLHQRDDTLYVEGLMDAGAGTPKQELDARRAYGANDPLISHLVLSRDARAMAFIADMEWPGEDYLEALNASVLEMREIARELEKQHGLRSYLGGEVYLEYVLHEASLHDALYLFPIVVLLGAAVLIYLVRHLLLTLLAVITILAATIASAGIAGWSGVVLDLTTTNFVLLVFIVCLADVAHLLTNFGDGLRQGLPVESALSRSIEQNFRAIVLTSLTTAAGFLTLNLTASPTFANLGNYAAVGVFAGLLFSLCMFPALACAVKYRSPPLRPEVNRGIDRLVAWGIYARGKLFVLSLLLGLLAAAHIGDNRLNDNVVNYFAPDHSLRQGIDFNSAHLAHYQRLLIDLDSGEPGAVNEPAFLAALQSLTNWLQQQPEIRLALGYDHLLKDINRVMHEGTDAHYRLPQTRELAAQYLLLYELGLEPGESLADLMDVEARRVQIAAVLEPLENEAVLGLVQRLKAWQQQNHPRLRLGVTGETYMFSRLSQRVVHGMVIGSLLAALLVSLVLWLGLGGWRLALLSLLPNLFPALLVFGWWGWRDGSLNMSAAITFSVSLGIIVDDTVHIVTKLHKRLQAGADVHSAVAGTLHATGAALVLTTCFVCAALLVQSQSDFGIPATIGQVCAPIIAVALVYDLLFLPGLVVALRALLTDQDTTD